MTVALAASRKAPKILIADDDPSVVQFLAYQCTKMGFEVQTAANGLQALIQARQSRPDVLLVDVNMPEVDGLSLCVRLLDPRKKRLDVVVMTGNSDSETIDICRAFGAVYGHKGPDLWKTVRSALTIIFPEMALEGADPEQPVPRVQVSARPRVLLVAADPEIGLFLGSRLDKAGVDLRVAPDGMQGFRIAFRQKPSVIISEHLTAEGDVTYLLSRLRNTPATEKIPLFVISGTRLDAVTEANLRRDFHGRRGVARLFVKPLDINELFPALQEFCALEYKAT